MFNMFNLLVEQACASEGRVVDRARAWCAALHVPYFRFNPQLSEDCNIDEHDDAKLVRVMWEARAYMQSQAGHLLQLKDFLLNRGGEQGALEPPLPPPRRSASASSTPVHRGKSRSAADLFPFASRPPPQQADSGESSANGSFKWVLSEDVLARTQTPTQITTRSNSFSSPEEIFYSTDSEFGRPLLRSCSKSTDETIKENVGPCETKIPSHSQSSTSFNESCKSDDVPDSVLTSSSSESAVNESHSSCTPTDAKCHVEKGSEMDVCEAEALSLCGEVN